MSVSWKIARAYTFRGAGSKAVSHAGVVSENVIGEVLLACRGLVPAKRVIGPLVDPTTHAPIEPVKPITCRACANILKLGEHRAEPVAEPWPPAPGADLFAAARAVLKQPGAMSIDVCWAMCLDVVRAGEKLRLELAAAREQLLDARAARVEAEIDPPTLVDPAPPTFPDLLCISCDVALLQVESIGGQCFECRACGRPPSPRGARQIAAERTVTP